jgi:pSer/pThr/pTyr-binding forkhead associated (FHA) protein
MKEKVLVVTRDANEQRIPLNKEKIVFGRDSNCDVVWSDPEFSREHVAVHNKYDTIYIENVSTGGTLKINNKTTEYAELREGMEVVVGPYVIKWIYSNVLEKLESRKSSDGAIQTQSGIKAFSDPVSLDNIEATMPSASDPRLAVGELPIVEPTLQSNSGDLEMSDDVKDAIASDDTVTHLATAVGLLRIVSGEVIGREIRLDHGREWIVGRARECHISIDNPKLSRNHFKISQIGGGFRVVDLDSSYGVKINGVSVKDAPLKSYDVITAGPVEMQFAIIDKNLKDVPQLPAPMAVDLPSVIRDNGIATPAGSGNIHNEKTNWPPAVNGVRGGDFQYSKPSLENSASQGNFVSVNGHERQLLPKDRIINLIENFKEQPLPRKTLFLLIPLLILLALFSNEPQKEVADAKIKKEKVEEKKDGAAPEENPAESAQFSPEYQLKSAKEKAEIQELYAKAEEARNKGDWQKAYDLAQEVVKRAGKYKRASDIIAEAQGYLTDLQIATLSKTDTDAESMATAAKQKVEEYLKQGEEALKEKRWDDASEIYSKALLMDPKNEKATRGQYAAQAKDAGALGKQLEIERNLAEQKSSSSAAVVAPPVQPEPPPTNKVSIEGLSQQYQAAKQKIQEGAFREALPVLNDLKTEIETMIGDEEASRSPSGIIAEDKRNLRAKIMESLDLINDQFSLEYKTQMDDAQQAIANQKYVEARAIYDTIIKREPLFETPREEREKLYKKMMNDGQTAYREGLVSESVGDLSTAMEYYEKAKSFFESINKKEAEEYYAILDKKLKVLKK